MHSEKVLDLRASNNSITKYIVIQEFDSPMKPPLPSYLLPTARMFHTPSPSSSAVQ